MYSNNFLFFVHDGAKIQVKLNKVQHFPQNLKEIAEIYLFIIIIIIIIITIIIIIIFFSVIYLPLLKILHKMHVQCPHK